MSKTNNNTLPDIHWDNLKETRTDFIASELFHERKIFFTEDVNPRSMGVLMQALMYLDKISHEPIELYINSPGGEATSGMAVYQHITLKMKSPVYTYCIGTAASMASLLFLSGSKRYMYEGTKIVLHSPLSISDKYEKIAQLNNRLRTLEKTKDMTCRIISERTGHSIEETNDVIDKESVFSAEEAISYGLATEIIQADKSVKNFDNPFSASPEGKDLPFQPYKNNDNKDIPSFSDSDTVVINGIPQSLMHLNRTGKIPVYRFGFAYRFDDTKVIYANIEVKVTSTRFSGGRYNIDLGEPDTQYTCTLSDDSDPITLTASEISKIFMENKIKYAANKVKTRILST